ncbi:MAG: hypothetical protein U5K69_17780 [Balneolaceae bacterium]|nr:hypothetical protein [Balneolaceae bacterium]
MLRDLGLDRVDAQGATNPDNQIDFSTGTLDPVTGTIIFPYLKPLVRVLSLCFRRPHWDNRRSTGWPSTSCMLRKKPTPSETRKTILPD